MNVGIVSRAVRTELPRVSHTRPGLEGRRPCTWHLSLITYRDIATSSVIRAQRLVCSCPREGDVNLSLGMMTISVILKKKIQSWIKNSFRPQLVYRLWQQIRGMKAWTTISLILKTPYSLHFRLYDVLNFRHFHLSVYVSNLPTYGRFIPAFKEHI